MPVAQVVHRQLHGCILLSQLSCTPFIKQHTITDSVSDDGNQLRSGVGTMGTGGYIVPPSSGLVGLPPSQRCGLCQNFTQTTLTTRLYKVNSYKFVPPTYEDVTTRLQFRPSVCIHLNFRIAGPLTLSFFARACVGGL